MIVRASDVPFEIEPNTVRQSIVPLELALKIAASVITAALLVKVYSSVFTGLRTAGLAGVSQSHSVAMDQALG